MFLQCSLIWLKQVANGTIVTTRRTVHEWSLWQHATSKLKIFKLWQKSPSFKIRELSFIDCIHSGILAQNYLAKINKYVQRGRLITIKWKLNLSIPRAFVFSVKYVLYVQDYLAKSPRLVIGYGLARAQGSAGARASRGSGRKIFRCWEREHTTSLVLRSLTNKEALREAGRTALAPAATAIPRCTSASPPRSRTRSRSRQSARAQSSRLAR